jgi:phage-related protein
MLENLENIIFYEKENKEKPVEDFLDSLPDKHRAKAISELELLSKFGTELQKTIYAEAIKRKDYKGLWELRIKFASDISRILYFMPIRNQFVLLHGFVKKTQKTPEKELKTAFKNMEDYRRRFLK